MSTLLEQASLVMIPSGYKEDVVYSQIPTSGAGDLSFTRASNGTRINSAGLVEDVPWNLLQQSETFDNAVWTKSNVTVTTNQTTSPDGNLTADLLTPTTSDCNIRQSITPTSVNAYTFSVWLRSATGSDISTTIRVWRDSPFQNITNTAITVTSTWQRFTLNFTPLDLTSHAVVIGGSSTLSSGENLFIWGAQVNIGSTAKPYFPTTDRLNVPRLTYQNGGGGCPSLLLEKQSTNYARSSEDFTNTTYWTGSGSMAVTANQATSPDGTQNADLFYDSGARYNLVTAPVSSYYTFSCYFKRVDVTNVKVTASDFYSGDVEGTFNLVALTSSSTINGDWSNNSTKIESVGNGWYRCTVTALRGSGGSGVAYRVECAESAKSFYAWGYQCEASSYPTSYIPSTSSSATRVADACFKTGISSLIGQTEGTLFVDFDLKSTANTGTYDSIINIATDANNSIDIVKFNTTNELYVFAINGGVIQVNSTGISGTNIQGKHKLALAYKLNDYVCYLDGVQVFTDTSATVPACSNLYLGAYLGSANQLGGAISQAVLFKTRLTNAELASLTTI